MIFQQGSTDFWLLYIRELENGEIYEKNMSFINNINKFCIKDIYLDIENSPLYDLTTRLASYEKLDSPLCSITYIDWLIINYTEG